MEKESKPNKFGGVQDIYTFDNGYSASVVSNEFSFGGRDGLYELAVIYNDAIVYDTPITDDVLGYLTSDDLATRNNEGGEINGKT